MEQGNNCVSCSCLPSCLRSCSCVCPCIVPAPAVSLAHAPAYAPASDSLLQVRISKRKLVREGFHNLFSISRYHQPVILAAPTPGAAPAPGYAPEPRATPAPKAVPVFWQVQPGEEAGLLQGLAQQAAVEGAAGSGNVAKFSS